MVRGVECTLIALVQVGRQVVDDDACDALLRCDDLAGLFTAQLGQIGSQPRRSIRQDQKPICGHGAVTHQVGRFIDEAEVVEKIDQRQLVGAPNAFAERAVVDVVQDDDQIGP